jgi:hypothetical protein
MWSNRSLIESLRQVAVLRNRTKVQEKATRRFHGFLGNRPPS